ncbi:MAG: hypothetical protein U1B84_27145, partial [Variovorax sp.]|nr:hypothetical protein [Variovorax sp.]
MDMAAVSPPQAEVFSYDFVLPIPAEGSTHRRLEVIGVFRTMAAARVERWVMDADGLPRADHELAAEVLIEFRRVCGTSGLTSPLQVEMTQVLASTKATAAIVSAFLAGHPRAATRIGRTRSRCKTQWAWGGHAGSPDA